MNHSRPSANAILTLPASLFPKLSITVNNQCGGNLIVTSADYTQIDSSFDLDNKTQIRSMLVNNYGPGTLDELIVADHSKKENLISLWVGVTADGVYSFVFIALMVFPGASSQQRINRYRFRFSLRA